ncbi:hypothetical protein M427DRAFT_252997 [Gonapodya prolifera JEL478]|uniref:Uncharacterized protein n=1 Tax=Gonapodya prolifera (strain JEL478) TaxID=1344416 RepID=A0A139ALS3_GONPJ|nr:hypothetical protein M427DRAFT_252997 [Gonapodya prolifera JEL478]|eukprot:KXS17514.1 hypothetical protein M427DRAFT_252997 [Gonapodya prolifera JEL478]
MWPSADASLPENGGVFGQGFFPDENRPPTPPPSSAFAHAPLSPGTVARIEQSRLQALARLEARKAARLAEDEERRRREAEEEAAMRADEEATRAMGDDDDMRADEEAAREMEAAMRADEEAARDVEAAMRVDEEERRQDGGAGGHRAGHGDASLPGSHHPVPNDTSAAMKRAREALARGEHVSPDDMMQLMMADDDVDGGNAGATSGEWDAVGKLGSKAPMDEDEMFM